MVTIILKLFFNRLARPMLTFSTSVPQSGLDLIGALSACVTLLIFFHTSSPSRAIVS